MFGPSPRFCTTAVNTPAGLKTMKSLNPDIPLPTPSPSESSTNTVEMATSYAPYSDAMRLGQGYAPPEHVVFFTNLPTASTHIPRTSVSTARWCLIRPDPARRSPRCCLGRRIKTRCVLTCLILWVPADAGRIDSNVLGAVCRQAQVGLLSRSRVCGSDIGHPAAT